MQHQGLTLSYCATNLEMLIHDAGKHSGDANHDLHRCTSSDIHIGEGSDELSDPLIENGDVKIQNYCEESMTEEQCGACERLLLSANEEEWLSNSAQPNAQEILH